MHKLRWLVLALPTIAALAAAGCGGDDDSGGGDGGGDAGGEPIKIGASLPLTGDFSEPGKAAKQGYEVWQAMVNANGGLHRGRPVKLIIKDDASNQNTIVADYNALISQDKVDLLLGTFSSLLNLPASAVAEKNRMLYVEPAGGAPDCSSRGFKIPLLRPAGHGRQAGRGLGRLGDPVARGPAPEDCRLPDARRPVRAADLRGDRGDLQKAGIKTVYRETYTIDNTNFDSIASAIKSRNPDLVVHGATFEDGVGMVRAFRKSGFTPKMLYQTDGPVPG